MSTRMPPRGNEPQRPPYRPPANTAKGSKGPAAPGQRRGFFDIVVFVVAIAIVALLIKQLGGGTVTAGNPAITPKANKTAKTGQTAGVSATAGAPVTNVPIITELMPSNSGSITDEKGEYVDWIELYNPTNQAINLAGFAMSDNIKKPKKFVLPTYMLDPGEYVIVYADGQDSTNQEIHAKFKLKNASQAVVMIDPNGKEIQRVSYPSLETNWSYAMDLGTREWTKTEKYTPGFSNDDDGFAAYQQVRRASAQVNIDEVMAGNSLTLKDGDGEYSDWVELYNSSDKAIDLTGWGLSNKEDVPKRWVFPKMKIEPGKYVLVFCSGKNRAEAGKELHTDFRLNAFKDTILLSNLRGQIVSEVQINRQKNDESFGQIPSSDNWQVFAHPTPGYPNTEAGWNDFQKTLYADTGNEPVVISEVMTNNVNTLKDQFGDYPDWIELYNRSNESVDLKGWGLTDSSDELGRWQFPEMSLGAGKYITVFASGKNLSDADAVNEKKLHTDFGLSGAGGIVALTSPAGKIADRCFVPSLRAGLSYDRQADGKGFGYSTNPTPGDANASGGYPGMAPEPVYSVKAGIYDGDQQVALTSADPDAKIYYTTNGDAPTQSSKLYTGPIDVKKPDKEFGATVIRAVAFRDGYLPSNVATSTYIIGQNITLPVLSIAVDNEDMFDPATGLYSKGSRAESKYPFDKANFYKRGRSSELPAHLEIFDPDNPKELVPVSQDIGIQIFGQYSRGDVYKGFELVARSEYGKGSFDYQVFPDIPYASYKSIISKPGGQDVKSSGMRDMLTISLARDTIPGDKTVGGPSVFTQDVRLALEFVNGEFWGVTTLHEKTDVNTLAKHYPGANTDKIDLIDTTGKAKAGSNKDFQALINYAKSHDLSNAEYYNEISQKMDIDSYINWFTLEICCGNSDMGNIRIWKSSTLDNKFRWIYYDFCWAFWPSFLDPGNPRYMSDIHLDIEGEHTGSSSNKALVQALLKNPEFKDKFIRQLAYNLNVTFETNHVLQRIDEIAGAMQPYMAAEDLKWRDLSTQNSSTSGYINWDKKVESIRTYARQHPGLVKQEMKSYFHLSDAEMKQLFPNN